MYALVRQGIVEKITSRLPQNWENVSGLAWLPPAKLVELGWLPVNDTKPALGPLESYGEPVVTIGATEVARTYPVVSPTVPAARQQKRQQLRDELKAKLYQNLDVDDYVALLVMQVVPAGIKTRVEAIKTAYDAAIAAVNAAGTVADVLAVTAAWPA